MAEAEVKWAPIYVLGAGYKKLNGAYINAGNYEGRLRYKHPKEMIWCFWNGEKNFWCFSNKSRYLADGKVLYKNRKNDKEDDPIPMRTWKYHQSPGVNPAPKVVNTAFVQGEEVDIYSKKSKKWTQGKIAKANDVGGSKKGSYKCNIKGLRKAINIPREQIRMLADTKYATKQFVEIKTKNGSWLLSMIGEVKDDGKYYIVLPDGKGATFPESKIRPTEMCRDAVDSVHTDGGAAATSGGETSKATSSDNASAALLKQKDMKIAELESRLANLETSARKGSFSEGAGSHVDQQLIQEILEKQKQLEDLVVDISGLISRLQ